MTSKQHSFDPKAHTKPSHKLTKIPPKFLQPKPFLSLAQRNSQSQFQATKEFKPKQYCQKFFGKKVQYVQDSHSLNQAINSSYKFFQKVKFEKNVISKDGFKATGGLVLLGKDVFIRKRQVLKAVRRCKGKVTIALKKNLYEYNEQEMYQMRQAGLRENPVKRNYQAWAMKFMKNCHPSLQGLSLILQSYEQIPTERRIWEGLRRLKNFSFKFDQEFARQLGWKSWDPLPYNFRDCKDEYFTFFIRLIKEVRKLKTLRVDLAPYSITPTPLAYLLLSLKSYEVSDWYVRFGALSQDFLKVVNGVNIEEINKMTPFGLKSTLEVLKQVDFLAISAVNYDQEVGDECIDSEPDHYGTFRGSVPRLGEMPQVTSRFRKILDVTFPDFNTRKNLTNLQAVLSRFPALQGLYIKAAENIVTFDDSKGGMKTKDNFRGDAKENEWEVQLYGSKEEKTHELIIEDPKESKNVNTFDWIKNLRNVYLSFLSIKFIGEDGGDEFMLTNVFANLMKALKTHGTNKLSTLNIYRSFPVFKGNGHVIWEKRNPITVPCDEISGLKYLSELEITTDHKGMKDLGKSLNSLKNLEKLKINVVNNDHLGAFAEDMNEEFDDMDFQEDEEDFDEEDDEFNEDEEEDFDEDEDEDDFDEDDFGGGRARGRGGPGRRRGQGYFGGRGVMIGGGQGEKQDSNNGLEEVLANIPGVKELELVIQEGKDPIDGPKKKNFFKWTEALVKGIPGLRNLEVLKVVDKKKLEIPLEMMTKIVGGLAGKTRLKEVLIDSEIAKNTASLEFAAELMGEMPKNVEELAIRSLKGKIKQMIDSNQGLKKVEIRSFKGLKVDNIFYHK